MDHPIRLLIIPVVIVVNMLCLVCAGWAKASLPHRPAVAEAISTALFWITMVGTVVTGIWIAGGI